jgi:type IV secretion system protein VirD4
MIERPLMTADELKTMPKGHFVVMKTGAHPMRVKLKLFFDWGIEFDEKNPYSVEENADRKVKYASMNELEFAILWKYHPEQFADPTAEGKKGGGISGMVQTESQMHEPQRSPKGGRRGMNVGEQESKRQVPFTEAKADIGGKT